MIISSIHSKEILDSRGEPTIETTVILENGVRGVASVASGASTGIHEALELRDGDSKRYMGKGVLNAIKNVEEEIAPHIVGMDAREQSAIDYKMNSLDGTENKKRLGANAILSVSLACARAYANHLGVELFEYLRVIFGSNGAYYMPLPMFNILNGGKHADNNLDVQEYMILPVGASDFATAVRMGSEVYHSLKKVLNEKGLATGVGDEGGFAPKVSNLDEPLEFISSAIEKAGYRLGKDIKIGMDVAASSFFEKSEGYKSTTLNKKLSVEEIIEMYEKWHDKFHVAIIEDGFAEDDWDAWKKLTEKMSKKVQLIGDDLLVTNVKRIQIAIDKNIANAVLIKVNQIGTLTETFDAIKLAKLNNYGVVISHRSGETNDAFIADLAVATNAMQIKTGSLARGERLAKYNRLMEIERILGNKSVFKSVI